jgi:hypothetical protein
MALANYTQAVAKHRAAFEAVTTGGTQPVPVHERTVDLLTDFEALLEALEALTEGMPRKIHTDDVAEVVWDALGLDGAS